VIRNAGAGFPSDHAPNKDFDHAYHLRSTDLVIYASGYLVDIINLGGSAALDALREGGRHEFIEVAIEHG
jgi:hypothetical protein